MGSARRGSNPLAVVAKLHPSASRLCTRASAWVHRTRWRCRGEMRTPHRQRKAHPAIRNKHRPSQPASAKILSPPPRRGRRNRAFKYGPPVRTPGKFANAAVPKIQVGCAISRQGVAPEMHLTVAAMPPQKPKAKFTRVGPHAARGLACVLHRRLVRLGVRNRASASPSDACPLAPRISYRVLLASWRYLRDVPDARGTNQVVEDPYAPLMGHVAWRLQFISVCWPFCDLYWTFCQAPVLSASHTGDRQFGRYAFRCMRPR